MSWQGRLMGLFPSIFFIGLILIFFTTDDLLASLLLITAWIYLLPPLLCRLHSLIYPLPDGFYDLAKREYNPWWGCHQLQIPFIAIPWLEAPLHFFPGFFSAWLRLWGSKIGRGVYWTPQVEILDRNLVEVGDRALFGHRTAMCSHMVIEKEGRAQLMIRRVKVGQGAFVSVLCLLGPGSEIPDRTKMKPMTKTYWRGEWS